MILASAPIWTLLASVLAVLCYVLPALAPQRLGDGQTRRLLWLACGFHALSLLGNFAPPLRFGFAPALSATAWLVLTAYLVESQFYPQLRGRWALGGLGALTVVPPRLCPGNALPLH